MGKGSVIELPKPKRDGVTEDRQLAVAILKLIKQYYPEVTWITRVHENGVLTAIQVHHEPHPACRVSDDKTR